MCTFDFFMLKCNDFRYGIMVIGAKLVEEIVLIQILRITVAAVYGIMKRT